MPKDILIYLFIHLFYFLLSERETTRDSSPEMEKHTGWLHCCFSLHDFSEKKKKTVVTGESNVYLYLNSNQV